MGSTAAKFPYIVTRKILLLYPYYWPHYKAGGPVQSLFNLAGLFQKEANFFLVSKDRDIDGSKPAVALVKNQWIQGPQQEQIYYTPLITTLLLYRLMRSVRPDVIMINGMFNLNTTLNGIIIANWLGIRVIISPRGMLQAWGLKRNRLVKSMYLALIKLLIHRKEIWHATDVKEEMDIRRRFGNTQHIVIASNIPRAISQPLQVNWITSGQKIKLVFLSLINPNKNLHLVIEAVNSLDALYSLDIYGPVIDKAYWNKCASAIKNGSNINYHGPIPPWEVPAILGQSHFLILPTQGENFGHAIFDALSIGTPVITTRHTPWQNLDSSHAGFYIDLENPDSIKDTLERIAILLPHEYESYRSGSITYARQYLANKNYRAEYNFLLQ